MEKISKENNYIYIINEQRFSNIDEFQTFLLGSIIFLSLMPFFIWNYGLNLFLGINSLFFFLGRKHIKKKISFSTWVSFIFFIFLFAFTIFEDRITLITFYKYLTHVFILFFLFLNENFVVRVYRSFKIILSYSLLLSFFLYILVLFNLFQIPIYYIKPLNSLKEFDYLVYFFLTSIDTIDLINIRFFGIFDEPGVVGTITGLILYIERFNFKDKKNIIFFLSGFFSFSLFFFFITASFFVLREKNFRSLFFYFFLFLIYNYTRSNDTLNDLIWSRFNIIDGWVMGDNRASETLANQFSTFLSSSDLFFGRGTEYTLQYSEGSSSYILVLMSKGLIFTIFLCFVYFYLIISKKVGINSYSDFAIIFLGMMYQRPYYLEVYFFFIFFIASIIYARRSKNSL
jgi:hypothetical protein